MEKFKLKRTLDAIKFYMASHYTKSDLPMKDFYNIYTGEITCGKCDKTMSPLRALIHFHI